MWWELSSLVLQGRPLGLSPCLPSGSCLQVPRITHRNPSTAGSKKNDIVPEQRYTAYQAGSAGQFTTFCPSLDGFNPLSLRHVQFVHFQPAQFAISAGERAMNVHRRRAAPAASSTGERRLQRSYGF